MLSYGKLWLLLQERGMKKTDLKQVISSNTLAKLGKNETISSAVIEKICEFLDCQPGEIMEYVSEEKVKKTMHQLDAMQGLMMENLKEANISREEFQTAMNTFFDRLFDGENPMSELGEELLKAAKIEEKEENKD